MIQLLPNSDILTPDVNSSEKTVEYINNYIDKYHCEKIKIDISFLNVIDACYVSTMCSTKHFIKYPNGKIDWKVSSKLVNDFSNKLNLGNTTYSH